MKIGVIGIIIEKDRAMAEEVQKILSAFGDMIIGRMGLPYKEKSIFVISIIVQGTNEQISSLSGKLGKLKNVKVKTAVTDLL